MNAGVGLDGTQDDGTDAILLVLAGRCGGGRVCLNPHGQPATPLGGNGLQRGNGRVPPTDVTGLVLTEAAAAV